MNASQKTEHVLAGAGCVYCLLCVALFSSCVNWFRTPVVGSHPPPNTVMTPFEVLGWLVWAVLKAMYPFLFKEP